MSERNKIEITYDRVDIDSDIVHTIESIQAYLNDFVSKGATHIRFSPQSSYDEVELYPLSYRDETDEEFNRRISRDEQFNKQHMEHQRRQYEELKKIFG